MLSLRHVSKSYEKRVLSSISYEFPAHGLFRVTGKSGSGKTTLLRLIAGLDLPDSGTIIWTQKPKISMVFQEPRLIPHMTLLENVLFVADKRDPQRAIELLTCLGLGDDKDKKPSMLSGGMKLRASIARALYFDGNVFLLDEPTRELDEENKENVISLIEPLSKKALVLCATHESAWHTGVEICL